MGPPQSRRRSRRRTVGRSRSISPFYLAAQILAFVSVTVGWFRGGRTERFAAGVLLLDYLLTAVADSGGFPHARTIELASESAVALTFVWLAVTSARWWPIVAAAALVLGGMVFFLELATHHLSFYASRSAQIGLWMVIYLALMAGVGERRLAGERPGAETAVWRRRRVTS